MEAQSYTAEERRAANQVWAAAGAYGFEPLFLARNNIVVPVTGLDEHGDLLSGADLFRVKGGPEKVAVRLLSFMPVS